MPDTAGTQELFVRHVSGFSKCTNSLRASLRISDQHTKLNNSPRQLIENYQIYIHNEQPHEVYRYKCTLESQPSVGRGQHLVLK